MKLLQLAFLRIEHYFQSNKLLFILYIVGTAACSITFIYFYGNGNSSNRSDSYYMQRSYNLTFTQELSQEKMIAKIEDIIYEPIEDYFMKKKIYPNQVVFNGKTVEEMIDPWVYDDVYLDQGNDRMLLVGCYVNQSQSLIPMVGRTELLNSNEAFETFLNSDFAVSASLHVDDTLSIAGQDFKIIGTTGSFLANIFLPYESFFQLESDLSFCRIILKQNPTLEESGRILKELEIAFPNAKVEGPEFFLKHKNQSATENQLLAVFLYFVGLISFLFLVQYMLSRSRQEIIIFGLVGAKKRILLVLLLIENIFLTLLSAGLGMMVYFTLQRSVFLPFSVAASYVYTAGDIGCILLLLLAVSLLAAFPFYWQYCCRTLTQMKTHYML